MKNRALTFILDLLVLCAVVALSAAVIRLAWINYYKAAYPLGYNGLVLEHSEKTGVPPALIFAVIRTESGFNPSAKSHVEARGLMQITYDTFEWTKYRLKEEQNLHFDDLFKSEVNIRYGSELLRLLLDEFGSETNALCAYHSGWGNAKRWLDNPEYSVDGEIVRIPSAATGGYVAKVLEAKRMYEKLYNF